MASIGAPLPSLTTLPGPRCCCREDEPDGEAAGDGDDFVVGDGEPDGFIVGNQMD